MKNDLEICIDALTQAFGGNSVPSFRSQVFAETLAAANRLTAEPNSQTNDFALKKIGLVAMGLLTAQLVASMQSERALSVMRGR